ncbi:MAG: hypothetical protein K9G60_01900 [Pseudolabrys sp.]|nr:hypothetical protein [Pseudolabrys sp.]
MRLVDYPFVMVRFRCDLCKRSGQSRLARLADKHGCMTTLDALVDRVTRDCPWRKDGASELKECGIYLPDLPAKVPPDLPPGMVKLRAVR